MLPPVVSHGITWVLLGTLLAALATSLPPLAMAALLWTAASFAAVGLAYLFDHRGAFGKRSNGTLATPHVIILAPFLLFTWSVWHLARLLSREPAIAILTTINAGLRSIMEKGSIPQTVYVEVFLTFRT